MDKLNAMQTFVWVAECGSFSAVADRMHVARSAVTRLISALENQLGAKLITRSTRSLSLTAAGLAYLEHCRQILNMVDAAESGLSQENTEPRGRIRLGLPFSFGLQCLMPALTEFAKAHDQIELVMDFSDRRSNLIEEGIDLSIRITHRLEPGDILRKLGQSRLLTVASPAYLAAHKTPKHPQDLVRHACLVYSHEFQSTTWAFRSQNEAIHVNIRPRMAANSGEALLHAASQGLGITRPPEFMAKPYLDQGSIVPILGKYEPEPLGVYAVLPSNRYIPHRVSFLVDFIADHLARR